MILIMSITTSCAPLAAALEAILPQLGCALVRGERLVAVADSELLPRPHRPERAHGRAVRVGLKLDGRARRARVVEEVEAREERRALEGGRSLGGAREELEVREGGELRGEGLELLAVPQLPPLLPLSLPSDPPDAPLPLPLLCVPSALPSPPSSPPASPSPSSSCSAARLALSSAAAVAWTSARLQGAPSAPPLLRPARDRRSGGSWPLRASCSRTLR